MFPRMSERKAKLKPRPEESPVVDSGHQVDVTEVPGEPTGF